MIVRIFCVTSVKEIKRYPMFKSVTDLKVNSQVSNFFDGRKREFFCFRILLSWWESMTSWIDPFFFGTPKHGKDHSHSLTSSAESLWRAPILHWQYISSLKTSRFLSGTAYGFSQTGFVPSMISIDTGGPLHSPHFLWKWASCCSSAERSFTCCSFVRSFQSFELVARSAFA